MSGAVVKLAKKAERGTGTSISVNLAEWPGLLEKIRAAAKADDREPANWLRRRLVKLDEDGKLFPSE